MFKEDIVWVYFVNECINKEKVLIGRKRLIDYYIQLLNLVVVNREKSKLQVINVQVSSKVNLFVDVVQNMEDGDNSFLYI